MREVIGIALIAAFASMGILVYACAAEKPTVESGGKILDYAKRLQECQDKGKITNSYRTYEDCTKEAGL